MQLQSFLCSTQTQKTTKETIPSSNQRRETSKFHRKIRIIDSIYQCFFNRILLSKMLCSVINVLIVVVFLFGFDRCFLLGK